MRHFNRKTELFNEFNNQAGTLLRACSDFPWLNGYLVPFLSSSRKACMILLKTGEHAEQIEELDDALTESKVLTSILLDPIGRQGKADKSESDLSRHLKGEVSLLEHELDHPRRFALARRSVVNIRRILTALEEKFANEIDVRKEAYKAAQEAFESQATRAYTSVDSHATDRGEEGGFYDSHNDGMSDSVEVEGGADEEVGSAETDSHSIVTPTTDKRSQLKSVEAATTASNPTTVGAHTTIPRAVLKGRRKRSSGSGWRPSRKTWEFFHDIRTAGNAE